MSSCSENVEAIELDPALPDTTEFALESSTNAGEPQHKNDGRRPRLSGRALLRRGTYAREKFRGSLRRVPVKKWQKFELGVVVLAIVAVWGLLSLPVIFYYLPENKENNGTVTTPEIHNTEVNVSGSGLISGMGSGHDDNYTCMVTYEGQYCREALKSLQMCIPGRTNTTEIYVGNHHNDQSALEEGVNQLLYALELLIKPSEECRKKVIPFFCLYTFGLCGENNDDYKPTAAECENIRDKVCQSEWQTATDSLSLLGQSLPDCNTFDADGFYCSGNNLTTLEDSPCTTDCHDQFYCHNNFCLPRCDGFEGFSDSYVLTTDVVAAVSGCICLLAGSLVLVISCLRHKKIMTFPSVLTVYMTLTIMVFGFILVITYVDRSALYCSSIDLVQSVKSPTAYCEFSGAAFYYVTFQASIWWLCHVCVMFWKVQFPFHARSFEIANRIKYIHVTCVILALLLPLVPVITAAKKGGFTVTRFPPFFCLGSDADATFYALVLPVAIILGIGTTLLVLIFWIIHKQYGLFRAKKLQSPVTIGPAERRILLVFLYYITLGAVALTSFTLFTKYSSHNLTETLQYFECEKSGRNSTCNLDLKQFPTVTVTSNVLLSLLPAINLVYAVNIRELKSVFKRLCSKKTVVFNSERSSGSITSPRK